MATALKREKIVEEDSEGEIEVIDDPDLIEPRLVDFDMAAFREIIDYLVWLPDQPSGPPIMSQADFMEMYFPKH